MDRAGRRQALELLVAGEGMVRANVPMLMKANPFFDLAGEEFGQRLMLTNGADGEEYCLRPDFTLPIVQDYLEGGKKGPETYGYLGPIFRQRPEGPAEIEQAGIELIGQADPDAALDRVFSFVFEIISLFGVGELQIRLGSVELFEAVLGRLEMPSVWRPRLRHRYGHPEAMERLIERLTDPHSGTSGSLPWKRDALVNVVTDQLISAGFSIDGGRTPEEVADRYFEKQQLAAARVPPETVQFLREFLATSGTQRDGLECVKKFADKAGINLDDEVSRIARHADFLSAHALVRDVSFDAGFSPRLDYYTGLVFEMTGAGDDVLASGGEYGRLLERLGAATRIAASGSAVWVDRLNAEASE